MRTSDWYLDHPIIYDQTIYRWQTFADDYVSPRRWTEYDRWTDNFLSALRKNSTADDVGWVLCETVTPLDRTHETLTDESDDYSFIDDLI